MTKAPSSFKIAGQTASQLTALAVQYTAERGIVVKESDVVREAVEEKISRDLKVKARQAKTTA